MPDPAAIIAADIGKIQTVGAAATAVAAGKAFAGVLRSFRRGDTQFWGRVDIIIQLAPILSDAMLLAWLAGIKRGRLEAERHVPALRLAHSDTFEEAVQFVQQRASLSDDDLRGLVGQFDANAVAVLHTAEAAAEAKLQAAIVEATREGVHVREGVKKLGAAFESAGLSPRNSFHLETIFRTQTAIAYGAGRWAADQDEAVQEILWGYEYVTVGDDRVRPTHVALDGTRAAKDSSFWQRFWPPNGWSCRCSTLRIFVDDPFVRRTTKLPEPTIDVGDREIQVVPDRGFAFNPGTVFRPPGAAAAAATVRAIPVGSRIAIEI